MKRNVHQERMNQMPNSEGFLKCKTGGGQGVGRVLEFQFNKETDVRTQMWYKIQDDFKTSDWNSTYETEVEDGNIEGGPRTTDDVISFKQTLAGTLTDDNSATFLQRFRAETLVSDDHILALLDHGINVRMTHIFSDGSIIRETYECVTTTNPGNLLRQLKQSDSETDMEFTLGKFPIIENIGFSGPLPNSIEDVSALVDVKAPDSTVTVTLDNILDPNELIYEITDKSKTWAVFAYNAETYEVVGSAYGNGEEPIEIADLPSGKVIITIQYASYQKGNITDYRTLAKNGIKTVDIKATPSKAPKSKSE